MSSDGKTCSKFCNIGEHPSTEYHSNYGVETSSYCKACDTSCRTCIDREDPWESIPTSLNCKTCKDDQYLKLESEESVIGECKAKTAKSASPFKDGVDFKILVLNADNQGKLAGDDSGLMQPDIMMAIFKAYELTSK